MHLHPGLPQLLQWGLDDKVVGEEGTVMDPKLLIEVRKELKEQYVAADDHLTFLRT